MKRFILFAQACTFSVFVLPLSLFAQDSEIAVPNYVVIGAFAHQQNAIHFTDEAKHDRYPAQFEMNPNRNLYYVYVLTTDDREYARAEALRLRSETKYFDAWVYSGVFGNIDVASINGEQQDFNPVTGQRLEVVNAREDQKPTAQRYIASRTTSNQGQTTTNENRPGPNGAGERRNNTTTYPGEPDQQDPSATNQKSTTGPPNSERTGATTPTERSHTQKQNAAGKTQIQNAAGETDGDQQTPISSDPALRQNGAVTDKAKSGGVQQQDRERSQKDLQQVSKAEQAASVSQEGMSSETTAALKAKNATKTAPSDAQQISTGPQNESQAHGAADKDDARAETEASITPQVVRIPPPVRKSTEPLSPEEVVGKDFYFHLYRGDNLNTVPGEVDAIDFEKSRKMGTYPGNEGVKVTMAGGKMKHISFVCQVFGYRKQQQEFDPESPSEQLYLDDKGNLVVPFELVRLQKGDIAIMYNVFFFKDAAVMRPESRYEVNNLLDLLVENPSYKIMIHGHTNGNASGKIIRMDKPGNFYSLTETKQGFGSAKQLSEERATVIRDFLISSGISTDRMQVKAWGGKKPIHDKHSVRAQENVRVEIEILSQ